MGILALEPITPAEPRRTPESGKETSTDSAWPPAAARSPQASACECNGEWIEAGVRQGRTARVMFLHGILHLFAGVLRLLVLAARARESQEEALRDVRILSPRPV